MFEAVLLMLVQAQTASPYQLPDGHVVYVCEEARAGSFSELFGGRKGVTARGKRFTITTVEAQNTVTYQYRKTTNSFAATFEGDIVSFARKSGRVTTNYKFDRSALKLSQYSVVSPLPGTETNSSGRDAVPGPDAACKTFLDYMQSR